MNWLSKLWRGSDSQRDVKVLQDPVFGEIDYDKMAGCWIGQIRFSPLDTETELHIDGSPEGPTEAHRQAWTIINEQFDRVREAIADELLDYWRDFCSDELDPPVNDDEVWKYVRLQTLSLDDVSDPENPSFELCLDVDFNPHLFLPRIENWRVEGMSVEG